MILILKRSRVEHKLPLGPRSRERETTHLMITALVLNQMMTFTPLLPRKEMLPKRRSKKKNKLKSYLKRRNRRNFKRKRKLLPPRQPRPKNWPRRRNP